MIDGCLCPDSDRGADSWNDVADGVPVGGVVGGGAKRKDGVPCHRTVEDEEGGV